MQSKDAEPVSSSPWGSLSASRRRTVTWTLVAAFAQLLLVDIYFRVTELQQIQQYLAGAPLNFAEDGIAYPPFVLSALACGLLVVASIVLVDLSAAENWRSIQFWLGSAWLLATVLLVLDLMIDTFEVKWPVILLFAFVGVGYWKGKKWSFLGLIIAPAVAGVATLDGMNHLSGQDCSQIGFDVCPAKGISDVYLVVILLLLTYVTARAYFKAQR